MPSITDLFAKASNGTAPVATTLASQKSNGAGSASISLATGWPTTTPVNGLLYKVDANNNMVANTLLVWKGILSGTTISSFSVKSGTDDVYAAGSVIEMAPTSSWADDLITGILVQHNQDGTHGAITTTSINNSGALTQTGASTLVGPLTIKSWDGWITDTNTWTYVSSTSFKIVGFNVTALFPVGTKLKLTDAASTKYFYVVSAAFTTDTTVTITAGTDYSLSGGSITNPSISSVANPQGFPSEFNYTPTITGVTLGNSTLTGTFLMIGKELRFTGHLTIGSTGSVSGSITTTLPVTANSRYGTASDFIMGTQVAKSSASTLRYPGVILSNNATTAAVSWLNASATYASYAFATSTVPFTWQATDTVDWFINYIVA